MVYGWAKRQIDKPLKSEKIAGVSIKTKGM